MEVKAEERFKFTEIDRKWCNFAEYNVDDRPLIEAAVFARDVAKQHEVFL